jgi:hypothetical protein
MLLALVTLAAAVSAAPPVTIMVSPGEQPAVVVKASGASVSVPACRGVVWERFDAEAGRYVPVDATPCGPLKEALILDKDGTRFALSFVAESAQVVRPVVVAGIGCREARPFPLAACTRVEAVEGPTITVRPKEE